MGVVEMVVVVEWLRADGDLVEAGEAIVVIESEKAETELESPASGRLKVLVEADDDVEVAVGTILGSITEP
jgi:pyruvate/2-oxoglutarate dehydrogenase complex dihydrolipoamide acyltransferase (E2) component